MKNKKGFAGLSLVLQMTITIISIMLPKSAIADGYQPTPQCQHPQYRYYIRSGGGERWVTRHPNCPRPTPTRNGFYFGEEWISFFTPRKGEISPINGRFIVIKEIDWRLSDGTTIHVHLNTSVGSEVNGYESVKLTGNALKILDFCFASDPRQPLSDYNTGFNYIDTALGKLEVQDGVITDFGAMDRCPFATTPVSH